MNNKNIKTPDATKLLGAASLTVAFFMPALLNATTNGIDEENAYQLRLMTQVFDGTREFSHTQNSAISRLRKGNESYTQIDFGDGSVVIDHGSEVQVGSYTNTSEAEAEFHYNYETQTLSGANAVADYFNNHIRQYLNEGPSLGTDGEWTSSVGFADLGAAGMSGDSVKLELARDYFSHNDTQYVLLTYDAPAFSYRLKSGAEVYHWGKGFVLTDPSFGEVYWSASLHRSVADQPGGVMRPYRYMRSMMMTDDSANPMVDPTSIAQTANLMDAFYGDAATEVIGTVVDLGIADQSPLMVAANLDMLALSLAENSVNQPGQITGQANSNQRGDQQDNTADDLAQLAGYGSKVPTAIKTINQPNASIEISPKNADAVANKLNNQIARLSQSQTSMARDAAEINAKSKDALNSLETVGELIGEEQALLEEIATLRATHDQKIDELNSLITKTNLTPNEYNKVKQLQAEVKALGGTIRPLESRSLTNANPSALVELVEDYDDILEEMEVLEGRSNALARQSQAITGELVEVQGQYLALPLETKSKVNYGLIDSLPGPLKGLVQSEGAKLFAKGGGHILAAGGDAANLYTIGKAGNNAITAVSKDMSSGDVQLTRSYDGKGLLIDLPMDLTFLFISAATGDIRGFVSDGVAITLGSLSDIFVAGVALKDFHRADLELMKQRHADQSMRIQRGIDKFEATLERIDLLLVLEESDLSLDEKDRLTARLEAAEPGSSEFNQLKATINSAPTRSRGESSDFDDAAKANLKAQLEARRAKRDAERAQAAREAAERARIAAEKKRKQEEYAGAQQRFEDSMRSDYPTVDNNPRPDTEDNTQKTPSNASVFDGTSLTAGIELATDIATDEDLIQLGFVWDLSPVDLDTYQAEKLRKAKEDQDAWWASLRKDARGDDIGAGVRKYDDYGITHYVTTSVDWNKPEFDMPTWAQPDFKPPKATQIGWTNFDGDDWPDTTKNFDDDARDEWKGNNMNLAFNYENMSGSVETDTSKWDEWIDGIGRRKLETLARQAGYPTLASALSDWKNLVRQSGDDGYRKWAMAAPSCNGYGGCGPNYLGRWSMKRSQLELGDLIGESAAFASSAGLSDISIRSLVLRFSVFDNALEDGDIVRVTVTQFGRKLFDQTITLTNAAQSFVVGLNRGVATVDMTAVNEGEFPPNTASIVIQDVVDGESAQDYSADEGSTATLKVGVAR